MFEIFKSIFQRKFLAHERFGNTKERRRCFKMFANTIMTKLGVIDFINNIIMLEVITRVPNTYLPTLQDFLGPSRDYSQLPGNSLPISLKTPGIQNTSLRAPWFSRFHKFCIFVVMSLSFYSIELQDILHHIADFIMFITSLYGSGWLSSSVRVCHWTSWQ